MVSECSSIHATVEKLFHRTSNMLLSKCNILKGTGRGKYKEEKNRNFQAACICMNVTSLHKNIITAS